MVPLRQPFAQLLHRLFLATSSGYTAALAVRLGCSFLGSSSLGYSGAVAVLGWVGVGRPSPEGLRPRGAKALLARGISRLFLTLS